NTKHDMRYDRSFYRKRKKKLSWKSIDQPAKGAEINLQDGQPQNDNRQSTILSNTCQSK
ncbi:hypothetical protein L9F63_016925, partial [Diploptera punctata]